MSIRDALDIMNDPARRSEGRFFGKYRGLVKDNKDPQGLGRIQATVPAISGMTTNWALPCTPYAGASVGFYTMPPVGAKVWIEFEGGDPTFPIWSGCFWQTGEVPAEVKTNNDDPSQVKVLKTRVATLWVNDTDKQGQVTLQFNDPTASEPVTITVVLDSTGLAITCQGSQGTSKVTMTPQDIQTNSATLGTTTSKDTTMTVQGKLTASVTSDVAITSSSGQLTASAASGSATVSAKDVTVSGTSSVTATGSQSVTVTGGSATMQATMGALTLSGMNATLTGTASAKVSGSTSLMLGGASISFTPA
jgi:uncharacterized protein involved in type VI secretion and phage assembly